MPKLRIGMPPKYKFLYISITTVYDDSFYLLGHIGLA
jgi:hypothetical protein